MKFDVLSFEQGKGLCLNGEPLKCVTGFELASGANEISQLKLTMYVDVKNIDK